MANPQIQVRVQETDTRYAVIGELFASKGEKFEEEDAEKLDSGPPTHPHFPSIITSVAVLKDLLDIPLDLSLVLTVAVFFLSLALALILAFWCMGKISGGWWKKSLIRWLWIRFFMMAVIEFIPFVQMVPANTIFVLMAHYKETKIVKLFNQALEIMHGQGITSGASARQAIMASWRERIEERVTPEAAARVAVGAVRGGVPGATLAAAQELRKAPNPKPANDNRERPPQRAA